MLLKNLEVIKRNMMVKLYTIWNISFRCATTKVKLTGITVLDVKGTALKKIDVSFIVHFCLGKYSLSHDTFWTHLICLLLFENV